MFITPLENIFTLHNLKQAFADISSKAVGLDEMSVKLFKEDLDANLLELSKSVVDGSYTPEPLKHIKIKKSSSDEFRPIGIGALKDKIVQKTISSELGEYFENHFSDKSYAYRPHRGSLKAISRVKDFLQRGYIWVYRSDIANFFEEIEHDKLFSLLLQQIADERVISLIALYLKNGSFQRYRYLEHFEGIHQGDPLSPLLSNIYLNQFDWFMENNDISFVRFGDDFVLLAHSQKELEVEVLKIEKFIKTLSLSINKNKSYTSHAIKKGFDFLGVRFDGYELSISKDRVDNAILKINTIIKSIHPFSQMVDKLNSYLLGLNRYYQKLLPQNHPQYKLLQDALLLSLSQRVTHDRKRGLITTKKKFRDLLNFVEYPTAMSAMQKRDFITRIITRGYDAYLAGKKYKKPSKKLTNKRKAYAKKFATTSTMYIGEAGVFLGVSYNKFVIKKSGRVIFSMPKTHCERIIIASLGVSMSANVVKLCASQGIAIDFIDKKVSTPYASLYANKNSYAKMSIKQVELLGTPMQMKLALAFIKGKVKNQINYLKYLNKYHQLLDSHIEKMEKKLSELLKKPKTPNSLMGHEGMSAILYWDALGLIVDDKIDFQGRVTYGAKDVVNSALNYGYAILYGRVHYHAVRAGLSLHISYLHALDDSKPTLVYDMIEEFRAFVVDRSIFTMINQNEPMKLDKEGRLDTKTKQKIAKNILEQIGSYTRHKKATKKIDTIIAEQAYLLSRSIKGLSTYKPFIGRY
jgi:group II intron reverse transcriptase/maturase/CRISPR-associated endonuclease Cas1